LSIINRADNPVFHALVNDARVFDAPNGCTLDADSAPIFAVINDRLDTYGLEVIGR
jgi:hypothetical protein